MRNRHFSAHFTRTQLIVLGFLGIILAGTFLLMLPPATKDGQETTVMGALFTSVSATCVTGLVKYDTWTHWSIFGQLVILTQIQIGGLGFITLGTFAMILLRRRIGLNGREMIRDSLSTSSISGGVRLVRHIIFGTILTEGAGALLLSFRFVPQMGFGKGIYYGIFHSVSAFCNAGFDLMGYSEEYISFCEYATDPLVVLVLVGLIITGGIGFLVWEDLISNHLHWKKYRLQTRIVLSTSAFLILAGTVLFLITERNNLFADTGAGESLLEALFCAVSPRTAGFNTVDTAALTDGSKFLTMFLMFVGGSPGSTAGGIKTTTLVVILLYIRAYVTRSEDCEIFHRRMNQDAIKRASVVIFINLTLAGCAVLVLLTGQDLPMADVLFESFSAIGTVGMSTGLTRDLNTVSGCMIMLLMFCGRVGSLTFAMSFSEHRRKGRVRYPEDDIIVG